MNFLVVSDTHGDIAGLKTVVDRHRKDVGMVIHLGDFARDLDQSFMKGIEFVAVPGNMDGLTRTQRDLETLLEICGRKVLITHSDHLGTHYDLLKLEERCMEAGAEICLFGHTHRPYADSGRKPALFNPGALGRRATGVTRPSYGILKLDEMLVDFEIRDL
ncbi:MAG: metallophosphoesterase family protein [Candidatus Wallbacteria bacterium]|nr:metallophosphoesterase family protein [Candidatus Wallbacteria bacterium]